MLRKIFIIFIVFFSFNNYSQSSIDSVKVDSLLNKAFELRWSNPSESILLSSKANEISKSINYWHGISKSYSFMGVAYENLSMYDEALKYYLLGLRVSDSLNLLSDKGFAYNNIANFYIGINNLNLAIQNLENGLKIAQEINDLELLAYIYRNFSFYHRKREEYSVALDYAKKSVEIREKLNDERGVITSLREILIIYFNSKDFLNAEKTLKRLYEIIGNNPRHNLQLARIKRTEAEILREKKRYDEALRVFDQSLELFKSIDNLEGIIRVYKLKADLYSYLGRYKEAFESIIQNNAYQDSLNNVRSIQKISLIEAEFRNKELQNKLLLASEELKQRNIILISLFIGFLILGVSVYFTQRANSEKKKLIAKISEQNKILEEDIIHKQKLLSIIGHDVKNPLSSVYSISDFLMDNSNSIDTNEVNTYLTIINKSVKNALNLLDNLLLWSMNKIGKLTYNFSDVNLKTIIDKTIELYDSNIKEKNIKIIVNVDNQIVNADENTLSAILRNLVNNAIKFCNKDGIIKIETENLDGFIKVKVIDNGKGLTEEEIKNILSNEQLITTSSKSESSTGLGLQIVKDFVKINKGELYIKSIPNQETEFSFTLPKAK
jgi:signal transduction histidine kinase